MSGFKVYNVGDTVQVKLKGWKKFFPGVIESYNSATKLYTVNFDDGDKYSNVKNYHIKPSKAGIPKIFTCNGQTFNLSEELRDFIKTNFSIQNMKEETIAKPAGSIHGNDFTIKEVEASNIYLLDYSAQVFVDNVRLSTVVIGPCSSSVFLRNVTNCTLHIACKQLRLRDCHNLTIGLYSTTEPVIESSREISVCPYQASMPKQTELFQSAALDESINNYANIFDFTAADSLSDPAFKVLEEEQWISWQSGSEHDDCPVDKFTNTAISDRKDSQFAFSLLKEKAPDVVTNNDEEQISKPIVEDIVEPNKKDKNVIVVETTQYDMSLPMWSEQNLKALVSFLLEVREKEGQNKQDKDIDLLKILNLLSAQAINTKFEFK